MNFYPLPEEEQRNPRQIENLLLEIWDQYGDGLSPERSFGGMKMVMDCIVKPLLTKLDAAEEP